MSGSPAPISLYVPQVDALRGLGALSVAFVHTNMGNLLGKGELSAFQTTAYRAIDLFGSATNANSALILFFVISGFLIALMLDRQPAGASVASFLTFLWRRALRIYPAHLVALAIFVPLAAFTLFAAGPSSLPVDPAFAPVAPWMDGQVYGRLDRGEFVHTALLQNNYYNPPVWSLQVEVLACLFMPAFAWLSARGSGGRDLLVLVFLVLAGLAIDDVRRADHVLLYLPAFYLGCLARTHGRRMANRLATHPAASLAALLVAYALLVGPEAAFGRAGHIYETVLAASFGGFLLVSLVAWCSLPRLDRLLRHRWALWLGRRCFSFYLWHFLILAAFVRLLLLLDINELMIGWPLSFFVLTLVVTIAGATLAAALSFRWIEKPWARIGRARPRAYFRWLSSRPGAWSRSRRAARNPAEAAIRRA